MPKRFGTPIGTLQQQKHQQMQQQLPRTSPFACAEGPNLVQCARRRLQYSQLPVRCPAKKSLTPSHQSVKLKFSGFGTPMRSRAKQPLEESGAAKFLAAVAGSPDVRKSLSMTDLSPAVVGAAGDFEPAGLRPDKNGSSSARPKGSASPLILKSPAESREPNSKSPEVEFRAKAASLVCRTLLVNAWRRKRREVKKLRVDISDLGQQIEHLKLQILVLRRLLDNENVRVGSLASELHRAKAHLDECQKEREKIKSVS